MVAQVEQRIILDKLTGRGRNKNDEELALVIVLQERLLPCGSSLFLQEGRMQGNVLDGCTKIRYAFFVMWKKGGESHSTK